MDVASTMTKAAPAAAREPRCCRCQSDGDPTSSPSVAAANCIIGDIQARWAKVTSRSVRGVNRCDMTFLLSAGRQRQRRVGAVEVLDGAEDQIRVADVLDVV